MVFICRGMELQIAVYLCTVKLVSHLKKRNKPLTHAMGISSTSYYGSNSRDSTQQQMNCEPVGVDWERTRASSQEGWDTDSKCGWSVGAVRVYAIKMSSSNTPFMHFICKIYMYFLYKFYLCGEKQLEEKDSIF